MLAMRSMTRIWQLPAAAAQVASGVAGRVVRAQAAIGPFHKTPHLSSLSSTIQSIQKLTLCAIPRGHFLRIAIIHPTSLYQSSILQVIMAGTRSSARLSKDGQSSPPASNNEAGTKRKASTDASPSKAKKGKKEDGQKTLEQTGIDTQTTKQEETSEDTKAETKEESKPQTQDSEMKDDKPGTLRRLLPTPFQWSSEQPC